MTALVYYIIFPDSGTRYLTWFLGNEGIKLGYFLSLSTNCEFSVLVMGGGVRRLSSSKEAFSRNVLLRRYTEREYL